MKKVAKYGALSFAGGAVTTLDTNQWIRLNMFYKIADKNAKKMKTGKESTSVGEYEYRDKSDGKEGQKLIIKKINYLSPGIFSFGSEKMAKNIGDLQ